MLSISNHLCKPRRQDSLAAQQAQPSCEARPRHLVGCQHGQPSAKGRSSRPTSGMKGNQAHTNP